MFEADGFCQPASPFPQYSNSPLDTKHPLNAVAAFLSNVFVLLRQEKVKKCGMCEASRLMALLFFRHPFEQPYIATVH
jgi:hypothetical protein